MHGPPRGTQTQQVETRHRASRPLVPESDAHGKGCRRQRRPTKDDVGPGSDLRRVVGQAHDHDQEQQHRRDPGGDPLKRDPLDLDHPRPVDRPARGGLSEPAPVDPEPDRRRQGQHEDVDIQEVGPGQPTPLGPPPAGGGAPPEGHGQVEQDAREPEERRPATPRPRASRPAGPCMPGRRPSTTATAGRTRRPPVRTARPLPGRRRPSGPRPAPRFGDRRELHPRALPRDQRQQAPARAWPARTP